MIFIPVFLSDVRVKPLHINHLICSFFKLERVFECHNPSLVNIGSWFPKKGIDNTYFLTIYLFLNSNFKQEFKH